MNWDEFPWQHSQAERYMKSGMGAPGLLLNVNLYFLSRCCFSYRLCISQYLCRMSALLVLLQKLLALVKPKKSSKSCHAGQASETTDNFKNWNLS